MLRVPKYCRVAEESDTEILTGAVLIVKSCWNLNQFYDFGIQKIWGFIEDLMKYCLTSTQGTVLITFGIDSKILSVSPIVVQAATHTAHECLW